jgi:hypothetical protein
MSDGEIPRSLQDTRIDVNDPSSCSHWSSQLGIPEAELKRIVQTVGDRLSDVENYLAEARLHEYFEDGNDEANPT